MKKLQNVAAKIVLILAMLFALCMLLGCQEGSNTVWAFGDSDAIGARAGTRIEAIDPNVEAGVSAMWLPDVEKPVAYGIYAVYHGPEVLEVLNPLIGFSGTISGHPYGGVKFDMDARFEQSMLSPIFGFIFAGDGESGISAFAEYQFESFDRTQIGESKLMMGAVYKY